MYDQPLHTLAGPTPAEEITRTELIRSRGACAGR